MRPAGIGEANKKARLRQTAQVTSIGDDGRRAAPAALELLRRLNLPRAGTTVRAAVADSHDAGPSPRSFAGVDYPSDASPRGSWGHRGMRQRIWLPHRRSRLTVSPFNPLTEIHRSGVTV